jgi:hypothetical protein
MCSTVISAAASRSAMVRASVRSTLPRENDAAPRRPRGGRSRGSRSGRAAAPRSWPGSARPAGARTGTGSRSIPGSRTGTPALTFRHFELKSPKPIVFPRDYPHNPSTLGERIRRRRMDRGLTQHQLADLLGCSARIVGCWKKDRNMPAATRWPQLEAVLGPNLTLFSGGFGDRFRKRAGPPGFDPEATGGKRRPYREDNSKP